MDGIQLKFDFTNGGQIEIDVLFDNPTDESYQLFGIILHSLEKEQSLIYTHIIKRLKELSKENEEVMLHIESIFSYKHIFAKNLDSPTIMPSQVFGSNKK